jgi:putative restriction endonuclease
MSAKNPPTAERYAEALRALEAHPVHRRMVVAQFGFPDHAATARQLSAVTGYRGFSAACGIYGTAGRFVAEALGLGPPRANTNSPGWWSILSTGDDTQGEFLWVMRPEVVTALRELGWVSEHLGVQLQPEELSSPSSLIEGASLRVTVNIYERSAEARQQCIEHHGCTCSVCGFDFGRAYGELGHGYIHVHHLTPLADIGEQYAVDPIHDLRPVCPNCHAMLHRREPPLSITDLQSIYAETRNA